MKEDPTYKELLDKNARLMEKLEWLEGVYEHHRDAGMQIKSRFLSNITHEIRTPMNAILGFTNLLNNDTLSLSEKNEYIQYIALSSQQLLKVMDNLIDMSLLENKSLQLKQEEVFAEELLWEIYNYYNTKIARTMNYRVALLLTTPLQYGRVTVKADGQRLQRVVDNLVSTAIEKQKKGVVEIKMEFTGAERLRFSIIGSRNELLEERARMIFENNGKSDSWHNHLDATGMALKLAMDLTTEMGGDVSYNQVNGKRAAVSINLPLSKVGTLNEPGRGKEARVLLN